MRTEEVLLAVHRPDAEFLVLLRAPERGGFWHLVSGGIEEGETPREAARRELEEETGLVAEPEPLALGLGYRLRKGTAITLHAFAVAAPAAWEPVLDEEHDEHRWCSEQAALAVLRYPEPRSAIAYVARSLELPA